MTAPSTPAMHKAPINPWSWQEPLGFSQAWKTEGAYSIVFVSGQGPVSPEGELVGEGDFAAQVTQLFRNLDTVLRSAGADLTALVKLTVYLTDISNLRDYSRIKARFLQGAQPASTVVEVGALAIPGMMVEVEAVAAI